MHASAVCTTKNALTCLRFVFKQKWAKNEQVHTHIEVCAQNAHFSHGEQLSSTGGGCVQDKRCKDENPQCRQFGHNTYVTAQTIQCTSFCSTLQLSILIYLDIYNIHLRLDLHVLIILTLPLATKV